MNISDRARLMIEAHPLRDYFMHMARKESGGRSDVTSSTGAKGLFQFTKGTGRHYGIFGEGGDKRGNDVDNTRAMINLTQDNMATLQRRLGRTPSYSELALAHQQGADTAANMLTGTGNASPTALSVNAVNPNASPQAAARKIMDFYGFDKLKNLLGAGGVPGMTLTANPAAVATAPIPSGPVVPGAPIASALPLSGPPPAPAGFAEAPKSFKENVDAISPGLEKLAKGLNLGGGSGGSSGGGAPSDLNTITPSSVGAAAGQQQASQAQLGGELLKALLQNRRKGYGVSLTG